LQQRSHIRQHVLPVPSSSVDLGPNALHVTGAIVAAYAAKNAIEIETLLKLIKQVHQTVLSIDVPDAPLNLTKIPAVPINESVHDEYLVCLEDGQRLKMLTRYLMRKYGMTPDEYRNKWKLASGYPMIAAAASKRRSSSARKSKFSQRPWRDGRTR
jgi:predicted transcriptional regulator